MKKSKQKAAKAKKAASKKSKPVKKMRMAAKAKPKAKPAKKATSKKAVPSGKKPTNRRAPRESSEKKLVEMFLKEMEQEAKTTRKMLSRIPENKYSWKPHERSMTIQRLATHIAELPSWVDMAINTDELNFEGSKYVPTVINNNEELMNLLEASLKKGRESLMNADDDLLDKRWVMRMGDTIISDMTKAEMIRAAFSQTVHHRAQLGVFLRLLDVPIPGSYGPSADEPNFF